MIGEVQNQSFLIGWMLWTGITNYIYSTSQVLTLRPFGVAGTAAGLFLIVDFLPVLLYAYWCMWENISDPGVSDYKILDTQLQNFLLGQHSFRVRVRICYYYYIIYNSGCAQFCYLFLLNCYASLLRCSALNLRATNVNWHYYWYIGMLYLTRKSFLKAF